MNKFELFLALIRSTISPFGMPDLLFYKFRIPIINS